MKSSKLLNSNVLWRNPLGETLNHDDELPIERMMILVGLRRTTSTVNHCLNTQISIFEHSLWETLILWTLINLDKMIL